MENENQNPQWTFLTPTERRVVGVLVEKAKTTPQAYPLTMNGIVTGSNQKSNRYPLTDLDEDDAEDALDKLRQRGAVMLVEGAGRVQKYRHKLYEWLGVDKVELAIMAELLLRGTQTEGELRGRAARMEPIRDVAELRPILDRLEAKNLIVRWGRMVTHHLYSPTELERQKQQFAGRADADDDSAEESPAAVSGHARFSESAARASRVESAADTERLFREMDDLRGRIQKLAEENETLREDVEALRKAVDDIRRDLGME